MNLDTLGVAGGKNTQGHAFDANTAVLWRCDEETELLWFTQGALDSGPSARNLFGGGGGAAPTQANTARPTKGPTANGARVFNNARFLSRYNTNIGADLATMQSTLTFECFLYCESIGATQWIYGYSGNGEALANNSQFDIYLNAAGRIAYFHEYGAGTDVNITSNTILTVGVWYHIAVTRDVTTRTVSFYLNGVADGSGTYGAGEVPDGGTDAFHSVGSYGGSNTNLAGRLASVRISTGVLDPGDIAADAALRLTTGQMPLTGSTVFLWQLNEQPDAIDLAGLVPLCRFSSNTVANPCSPLVDPNEGRSKQLYGGAATGYEYYAILGSTTGTSNQDYATQLAAVMSGDCTFEAWIEPFVAGAAFGKRGLFFFFSSAGELSFGISQAGTPDSNFTFTLDHSGGVAYTAANIISAANATVNGGFHLAWTKTVSGANETIRVYVNGVLVATSGLLANWSYAGTGNAAQIALGQGLLGPGYNTWQGKIDDVRISNIARDADAILASYTRGAGSGAIAKRPNP